KLYFDTNEGSYVSGVGSLGQPIGIGVTKPVEERSGGVGMGNFEGGMGMPGGMGIGGGNRSNQLPILIDPFTQEVISIEYKEDEDGEIILEDGEPITIKHDYWFRLKMKIAIKPTDSNSTTETPAPAGNGMF
ncbi:MAG: hypothetical protein MJE63_22480, partial [Proteobacteria bacterium]|nr:hypothetical protein [Pseudomonadota bacterium]